MKIITGNIKTRKEELEEVIEYNVWEYGEDHGLNEYWEDYNRYEPWHEDREDDYYWK